MTPSQSPRKKPVLIKRGSVVVKVYTGTNRVNGTEYPQFTVVYRDGNARKKERFAELDKAKVRAELIATKLANGENEVLKFSATDRALYLQAVELLKQLAVPIPLSVAVTEYANAVSRLPQGKSLKDAVDFFLARNPASLPVRSVREVADELIAAKTQAGRSTLHTRDLSSRLGAFADAVQMPIVDVDGRKIQAYLDGLPHSGRTKRNHLRHISTLFRFAVRRKYLPKDALDEVAGVEKPEAAVSETLIFSPAELKEMLFAVHARRPELLGALVIGAFCGLRSAEILRLDWRNIDLDARRVTVDAMSAKTRARRTVPLCDAALAWLALCPKREGRVSHYVEENKFHSGVVEAVNEARADERDAQIANGFDTTAKPIAKFTWKKNALRHSFCSYRVEQTKNINATALEAGNSAAMIFRHYRELVTEAEAKAWFGIMPAAAENIVTLSSQAA